ncbi:CehA/McbA family metallohydrolase [Candidatus Uhrbacteria bacterium]|nr:CehA/McbA family metallohydrolase [Candidatus Uhrbacteria bacterium]
MRLTTIVVAALAASISSGQAVPPPKWYDGDVHVHVQQCDDLAILTDAELVAELKANDVSVGCVQYWNPDHTDLSAPVYFNVFEPLITGTEIFTGDPSVVMQAGFELSGFHAQQFGHLQVLGASDGWIPNLPYLAPIIAYIKQTSPYALIGFAHARWLKSYQQLTPALIQHIWNPEIPADAIMGGVSFVEAYMFDDAGAIDPRALYYKLSNVGLRIAFVGGSDNSCIWDAIGDVRTYARVEGPLTYQSWIRAIRARRTTVSLGKDYFLNLEVNGQGIGSELSLPGPGTVAARVTLVASIGMPSSGTVRVLRGGDVAASIPYDLPAGGTFTAAAQVSVPESDWLAVEADVNGATKAHTSATYITVAGKLIVKAKDADYWVSILQTMADNIGVYNLDPQSEAELLGYLEEAKAMYEALAAYAKPLNASVSKIGVSTPACSGSIAAGLLGTPSAGASIVLTCLNAPPNASGYLLATTEQNQSMPINGIVSYVGMHPAMVVPVAVNAGGFCQYEPIIGSGIAGKTIYAQWIFVNPQGCGGLLSSSDGIAVSF